MPLLLERFREMRASVSSDTLPIRLGCRADYLALKPHHYRPGNPATMMRVLVMEDAAATPADRYLGRVPVPRPIAVLTESLPVLSCQLRDAALDGRYGHLRPKPRSALLNQELRCISRVIIDPRWRGLGLAVRLVRNALATATTRYTEALAVMGRVSPFFERAGMTAYERPPLPTDERALAALRYAGVEPHALAMPTTLEARIDRLAPTERAMLIRELTRWYRTAGGRSALRQPTLSDTLHTARQRLLARPIYYLHENTHAQADCPGPESPADRSTRRPPGKQQRDAQSPG